MRWVALALFFLLSARSGNPRAETDPTCRISLQSMVPRFLAGGEPANDNPFFSLLGQCGDRADLIALMEALSRPGPGREPLEITGAIEAALRSPELAHDAAATDLMVERFAAVRNPAARVSLSYLLGWRDAGPALNRILSDDPGPEVRAAAAVALRNCRTTPDFATLWHAAKLDPDRETRAQAYQTLDRFGQVKTADDLLAASRSQTDASNNGRFLGRWLTGGKARPEETAENLTRLAENRGTAEASGELSEIFMLLQQPPRPLITMMTPLPVPALPPGPDQARRMASIQPRPMETAKPGKSELQDALYRRRARISSAALAQFAASRNMQEDVARIAIDCALAINRCDRNGCEPLGQILSATDRMEPRLALEASHDISTQVGPLYFAHRYRQYALLAALAVLAAVTVMMSGFIRRSRRLLAIGVGWLLVIVPAAALQLTAGPISGVSVWPPIQLWPATAIGSVAASLLVAVAATLLWGRRWLVPIALIAGEIAWWAVPSLLAAAGVSLAMQHYSRDEDWLPFMLMLFMIVVAPVLTLAVSAISWWIGRAVVPEVIES